MKKWNDFLGTILSGNAAKADTFFCNFPLFLQVFGYRRLILLPILSCMHYSCQHTGSAWSTPSVHAHRKWKSYLLQVKHFLQWLRSHLILQQMQKHFIQPRKDEDECWLVHFIITKMLNFCLNYPIGQLSNLLIPAYPQNWSHVVTQYYYFLAPF